MGAAAIIFQNLAVLNFSNISDANTAQLIAQGVGDFIDNVLQELINTENSILNTIVTQRFGKAGYYVKSAKAFQLGDDLVPTGEFLDPGYAVIDASKQIIKQAAFENVEGALSLKIAKVDSLTGALLNLTPDELDAFKSYYVSFEIPGIPVSIVSLPGNTFNFTALCTYNAGYNFTLLKANIAVALTQFAQTFAFNGLLYSDQLSEYIKNQVPGVTDFFITNTQIDSVAFLGSTALTAGYFNYIQTITDNILYTAING